MAIWVFLSPKPAQDLKTSVRSIVLGKGACERRSLGVSGDLARSERAQLTKPKEVLSARHAYSSTGQGSNMALVRRQPSGDSTVPVEQACGRCHAPNVQKSKKLKIYPEGSLIDLWLATFTPIRLLSRTKLIMTMTCLLCVAMFWTLNVLKNTLPIADSA